MNSIIKKTKEVLQEINLIEEDKTEEIENFLRMEHKLESEHEEIFETLRSKNPPSEIFNEGGGKLIEEEEALVEEAVRELYRAETTTEEMEKILHSNNRKLKDLLSDLKSELTVNGIYHGDVENLIRELESCLEAMKWQYKALKSLRGLIEKEESIANSILEAEIKEAQNKEHTNFEKSVSETVEDIKEMEDLVNNLEREIRYFIKLIPYRKLPTYGGEGVEVYADLDDDGATKEEQEERLDEIRENFGQLRLESSKLATESLSDRLESLKLELKQVEEGAHPEMTG